MIKVIKTHRCEQVPLIYVLEDIYEGHIDDDEEEYWYIIDGVQYSYVDGKFQRESCDTGIPLTISDFKLDMLDKPVFKIRKREDSYEDITKQNRNISC